MMVLVFYMEEGESGQKRLQESIRQNPNIPLSAVSRRAFSFLQHIRQEKKSLFASLVTFSLWKC